MIPSICITGYGAYGTALSSDTIEARLFARQRLFQVGNWNKYLFIEVPLT